MRASAVFVLVALFASCEAQHLELVPEELSTSETADSGASGGSIGTGGRAASGGSGGSGGSVVSGGRFGAGGGPGTGGILAGTGGSSTSFRPCQRGGDCGFGYCENSQCVACNFPGYGCKEQMTCNTGTGRCGPYCNDREDCTDSFTSQCDLSRHLCVECADNEDCKTSPMGGVCAKNLGLCVECVEAKDCGPGNNLCNPLYDCKCVDDTACAPDRCDQKTHECVERQ